MRQVNTTADSVKFISEATKDGGKGCVMLHAIATFALIDNLLKKHLNIERDARSTRVMERKVLEWNGLEVICHQATEDLKRRWRELRRFRIGKINAFEIEEDLRLAERRR